MLRSFWIGPHSQLLSLVLYTGVVIDWRNKHTLLWPGCNTIPGGSSKKVLALMSCSKQKFAWQTIGDALEMVSFSILSGYRPSRYLYIFNHKHKTMYILYVPLSCLATMKWSKHVFFLRKDIFLLSYLSFSDGILTISKHNSTCSTSSTYITRVEHNTYTPWLSANAREYCMTSAK